LIRNSEALGGQLWDIPQW